MKTISSKILAAGLLLYGTAVNAQWTMQTSGTTANLFGLRFYDENNGIAVGWDAGDSEILRTADGGKPWGKTIVPNTLLFSVDYRDKNTVYVAGYDAGCNCGLIKKSTDGGAVWDPKNDLLISESYGFYNVIMYGDKGYVSGYNGAIVRTNNGWSSGYTLGNSGTTSEVFRVLEMTPGDTGFAGGGSSFGLMERLYRTTDGTNWEMIEDFGGNFSIGNLYFVNGKTGFMTGSNGLPVIMKTTDAGDSWNIKYLGKDNSLLVMDAALADGKAGYGITTGGELLRTDDAGETWKPEQKFNSAYLSTLHVVDANTAYAAGQGGIIVKRSGPAGVQSQTENEFDLQVRNQSGGSINVVLTSPSSQEINLSLSDSQGRVLKHKLPSKVRGDQSLQVSGLQPGTYILAAASDKSYVSRKFVIVH